MEGRLDVGEMQNGAKGGGGGISVAKRRLGV